MDKQTPTPYDTDIPLYQLATHLNGTTWNTQYPQSGPLDSQYQQSDPLETQYQQLNPLHTRYLQLSPLDPRYFKPSPLNPQYPQLGPLTIQYPQSGPVANQQQQLRNFWVNQFKEIRAVKEIKSHSLPLARIKRIMKFDESVRMVAAETPILFARACEMFVLELTLRSWNHAEENKRRVLQKDDIAEAIAREDLFDFLVETVPRAVPDDEDPNYQMPPQECLQLYAPPQQMWPHQQPQ